MQSVHTDVWERNIIHMHRQLRRRSSIHCNPGNRRKERTKTNWMSTRYQSGPRSKLVVTSMSGKGQSWFPFQLNTQTRLVKFEVQHPTRPELSSTFFDVLNAKLHCKNMAKVSQLLHTLQLTASSKAVATRTPAARGNSQVWK